MENLDPQQRKSLSSKKLAFCVGELYLYTRTPMFSNEKLDFSYTKMSAFCGQTQILSRVT